jgi:metallophosphoesterase (TIGR03768 family)
MLDRRDFLKYSVLTTVPVTSGLATAGCGGGGHGPIAGYAIASEVFTTLENTVVRGPKPAKAAHLYDVSMFRQYGYGNWTLGAPLAAEKRTDLMPAAYDVSGVSQKAKLLSFFTISDIHITDKESPNQLIYLGTQTEAVSPFSASLYSPVMMCTTHVLDAAIQTVNVLHASNPIDFGLSLGDCCNSSQYNELRWYIDVLDGKVINPSSGARLGSDRIDYQKPYQAAGLNKAIPWYQTVGNHDHFWMGSIPVDTPLRPDLRKSYTSDEVFATGSILKDPSKISEHTLSMGVIDGSTLNGDIKYAGLASSFPTVPTVAADLDRRAINRDEWLAEFFKTSSSPVGHGFNLTDAKAGFACYSFLPKSNLPLKMIVLDNTQREDDGSTDIHGHGFLDLPRWNWLKAELAAGDAAGQLMIIAAHIPLAVDETNPPPVLPPNTPQSPMGWWVNPNASAPVQNAVSLPDLISELHSHPNLLLWLAGHRHVNVVKAFVAPQTENSFWQVETPSLRDFPQQLRTFEIYLNSDTTISIVATDVDPAVQDGTPAAKSRSYAIAATQIVKGLDVIEDRNTTGDASIHRMPGGSYNAELFKKLSPAMALKMQTLLPTFCEHGCQ